ncbi:MAG: response regulator [Chitinispirillales bacterium]|jgi:PAS domain S-box-containing protein|nr:response regulator [Chitinispirillales bacterium]
MDKLKNNDETDFETSSGLNADAGNHCLSRDEPYSRHEQKKIERRLAQAQERARMMLDACPLICNFWNKNGEVFDCNKAALKLFGIKDKKEYMERFLELAPEFQSDGESTSSKARKVLKEAFEKGKCVFEWMNRKTDGTLIPMEVTLTRIPYGDQYAVVGYGRDLREQKAIMKKAAEESEKVVSLVHWYKSILDATPCPITVTDKNMNWTFVNKAVEDFLGTKLEDMTGKPCSNWNSHICNTDKCGIACAKRGLKRTHFNHDDRSYQVDIEILKDLNDETAGFIEVVQDVTMIKALTEEKNELTRVMFDNAPVGLTLFDENFKYIDCNDEVLKIYGVTKEFYSGFFGSSAHSPEHQPDGSNSHEKAMGIIKRLMNGENIRVEWVHLTPQGEPLPVELTMVRAKRDDRYIGFGYIYDMREQKKMEQQLIAAKELAEQSSRFKSEFLSNMSHEMRTPMNAIIGMTAIGKNANGMEQKNHALNKIGDASSHLLGVINDVLDMSKIEAGKLELAPVEYNLDRMLQNVMTIITFRVDEKRQNLTINVDRNVPRFIEGDEQRLSQVLTNIMANAVKFTPDEGEIHVEVSLAEKADGVCSLRFEVEDNGIGISEEARGELFNAFTQVERGKNRKFGGTGLGLTISKRIIELMGGQIWVESQLGKGSRFIFTVKALYSGKSLSTLLAHDVNWKNVRIMVVDDAKETLEQFKDIVNQLGIVCDITHDGYEASRMIKERGLYDIYFIDWLMPGINGTDLTRWIKSREICNPSVVTMITSAGWAQIKNEASAAGVDKYLLKPIFSSMLIDCVNDCAGMERIDKIYIKKAGEFAGKKILLVEDIEINREILITLLEDTGLIIDCAENGEDALKMIETFPGKYDAVFMDMQMPKMDGLEATRRIRALPGHERGALPIIAITANVLKDDIEACLGAGMDDHIGKPLDIDIILDKLRTYLYK